MASAKRQPSVLLLGAKREPGWSMAPVCSTRSSATADGPRDAMCQTKSCQLLHNSVGTSCATNPKQIEVV